MFDRLRSVLLPLAAAIGSAPGCAPDPESGKDPVLAGNGDAGGAGGNGDGAGGCDLPGAHVALRFDVPAGGEVTRCVEAAVDLAKERIRGLRARQAGAWHHISVYRSASSEPEAQPFECMAFASPGDNRPLLFSQLADETLALPEGVGYAIGSRPVVRLEVHALNATAADAEACAAVELLPAEDAAEDADLIFYGTGDFEVPAGGTLATEPAFIEVPAGTEIALLAGHTHVRGTRVRVERAAGPGAAGEAIYDEAGDLAGHWPTRAAGGPPFARGEGLRFSCEFRNDGDTPVPFGLGADDEMCALWAYYHPAAGFRLCMTEMYGQDFCCPGAPECAFF